jgi:hypothetical protein
VDRQVVREEMKQARQTFHDLLDSATGAELSQPSNGTKWTNGQLLFHMLVGYLIVVRLLVLVRIFSRLPDGFSRIFAGALGASTGPTAAIECASRASVLRLWPVSKRRIRAASLAGTSTTCSPSSRSRCASGRPTPLAPSTAQTRSGPGLGVGPHC